MKRKITFFELLTLMDKDKMPDAVSYWDDIYHKDLDGYYNHNGAPLMEVISLNESMSSIFYEKNISYDEPILTDEEKEYLSTVLKPFKGRSFYVKKRRTPPIRNGEYGYIEIVFMPPEQGALSYPDLDKPMYMGMEFNKEYSAEDLGLWTPIQ